MNSLPGISTKELRALGIVDWGHTQKATPVSYRHYRQWLREKKHGILRYLTGKRGEMRSSLINFYPDFQSAVVFLFDYTPTKANMESFYQGSESNGLKMAGYALGFEGCDYHLIIGERLHNIAERLQKTMSGLDYRISLDVHPVLERDLAYRAGLGWIGKNSMLISRQHGSFFILGSLLFNRPIGLETKPTETDHCGQCRACADACPTDAIDPLKRTLNADHCISTFTIENFKDDRSPPKNYQEKGGEIFGCDICQDVCPWNHKPLQTAVDLNWGPWSQKIINFFLKRSPRLIVHELEGLSNKGFVRLFRETVLARTGRIGLLKNIRWFKRQNFGPRS